MIMEIFTGLFAILMTLPVILVVFFPIFAIGWMIVKPMLPKSEDGSYLKAVKMQGIALGLMITIIMIVLTQ